MRTTNFSCAPRIGQATAEFVGATHFNGPWAMLRLYRYWQPMVRRLRQWPGYCGHHIWYRFPFTLGTIAFFADRQAMLSFARTPEHATLMRWVMEPGNARGGFIRFYDALPDGYSSGIWRAEPGKLMRAIEQFTPLDGEVQVPYVVDAARR